MGNAPLNTDPLVGDLERLLGREKVLSDFPARTAYSIDAGIYRIPPRLVVRILHARDLQRVVEYAGRHSIPLTARSAGTNLTGNAIGEGIILEFSGYNQILEVNREARWVRVQPGVNYGELNRTLHRDGLMFAPDPSSGEMCQIGGMLGNNAAGPHTLKYGATKDNVHAMEIILADGTPVHARSYHLSEPACQALLRSTPQLRELLDLIRSHRELIQARRPAVTKNSSGYNLFDLADGLEQDCLDLPRLLIGSEGTLGLTVEARLKLVPLPVEKVTILIYFAHLEEVGRAVEELMRLRPSAMEVMDDNAMEIVGKSDYGIPDSARALLLVEFDDQPAAEILPEVRQICRRYRLAGALQEALEPRAQEALWSARKAIYPALYRRAGRDRPINFADDVVVPAPRVAELLAWLDRYFKEEGIPVAIYGHIGNGNAHINPFLDLSDPGDIHQLVRTSKVIHERVIRDFGGSICGEHGDGRVRKAFVRELYGPELYRLFQQVKRLMDPQGILNPGVKIDLSDSPPEASAITQHLDVERFTKRCATCGKCNSVCPAFDVSGEESNSARGWFHILTSSEYSYENSGRVVEACLNCKACRVVCPAGIDVSEEILKKRAERPNRLAGAVFRWMDRPLLFENLLRLGGLTQPLWDRPWFRQILDHLSRPLLKRLAPTASIPARMVLPRMAFRNLRQRYSHLAEKRSGGESSRLDPPETVAYFHGCAANYFRDGVGDSMIRVLQKLGVPVVLPRQKCSGMPIQTYGLLEQVKDYARYNIESLLRFENVVTGCASCTLMLKDYPSLLNPGEERRKAEQLAARVLHITEFLTRKCPPVFRPETGPSRQPVVTYHSSCHLRAAGVTREPREILEKIPGLTFAEMRDADRCAGGAGTFLVKNYALSNEIFQRKRTAIEACQPDIVATSCPACMIRLQDGMGGSVAVRHVVQLVEEALGGE